MVKRHNPILTAIDYESPLTVGNGFFAYTFDVTGMQSLGRYYARNRNPLCTMAEWGWHTTPFGTDKFACGFGEVEMTEYDFCGRKVAYAAEKKKAMKRFMNGCAIIPTGIAWRKWDCYTTEGKSCRRT